MNLSLSIIKFFIYSNLFVSFCVTVFTQLTYIVYAIPRDNLAVVLLMVFSFTFFTYNGQRLYRLNKKIIKTTNLGERLIWVIQHKKILTIFSIVFGIIGLICSFFINSYCYLLLLPMGGLSIFYVIPLFPFYNKIRSLREVPYLKTIVVATTWSIAIVWLPMVDAQFYVGLDTTTLLLSLFQVFCFVFAISLPFDIRDITYDKRNKLKTIPLLIGTKFTILLAELFLVGAINFLYFLPIRDFIYPLTIGIVITMVVIGFTNEKRNELFYAGLIEGSVVILYSSVLSYTLIT